MITIRRSRVAPSGPRSRLARLGRPSALALTLIALAGPARAQLATGSLEVVLAEPLRAASLAVRLERAGRPERTAITDERGRARFAHLRPGRYRVVAPDLPSDGNASPEVEIWAGESWWLSLPGGLPRRLGADRSTSFSAGDLRATPRPANPWSVLRDVPGVVVDRVDVGGSETGLQSLVVARGDSGTGATWTIDGVDVTDPAALGSTTVFPDMDALAGVQVRTSALDVRVRTPGVQVALFLREPGPAFSGFAHLRGSADALQSDNLPSTLADRPFLRNRTRHVLEAGAEAGGRVGQRLWLWGAAARSALRQDTFTEHVEELRTTSLMAKARLEAGSGTLSLLGLRSEKMHDDRDTGFSAAPEARWRQAGPVHLVAVEDRRGLAGVSVLTRASWLDAGFTLKPPGGSGANFLEDFRGVVRGSYATFETERPRLQAGLEATAGRRWLGLDHELLAGAGYRRSRVTTRQAWPGNGVLAFERQSVFFRTFRLTGFALPTRDQDARSVQDQAEAYVQDMARRGRLALTLGLRLDRLAGRNLPSSVPANAVFPTLLPAVSYAGGPSRFTWLDLLPRAGASFDLRGDGRWTTRAGYAAYGASLSTSDVTFDNPIGREPASLTYYWLDRNGDHVVQADELDAFRGQVGSSGLDPRAPNSIVSPHAVEAGLRSPRTHELMGSFEHARGRSFRVGLHLAWSRSLRALWRPLRSLTVADYVIRGGVSGRLFDHEYNVGYFAPASESRVVSGNGRLLANREGHRQDALTVELAAAGRVGRLAWSAWGAFMDWREFFTDTQRALQDPTPLDTEPLQDAGMVAARPGGLGRGDVFVNARWMGGADLRAELPWKLAAAAHLHAHDGFPIPYFQVASTGDPTGGAKSVLISPHLDSFRLPALVLLDGRLSRELVLGRGRAALAVDVFNLLNRSTTLQVARDIELPAFGRPREILRPRLVRLGLEYRF